MSEEKEVLPGLTLSKLLDLAYPQFYTESQDGQSLVSATGEFLHVNSAFSDITEYTLTEMQRLRFQDITHPADVRTDVDQADLVRQGVLREYAMHKRYLTKRGMVVWVRIKVTGLYQNNNFLCFIVSAARILSDPNSSDDRTRNPAHYPRSEDSAATRAFAWLRQNWVILAAVLGGIGTMIGSALSIMK